MQGSASAGASASGNGTAATMAVPFSVDFTVQGASTPAFTITPKVYDAAGDLVTNAPGSQLLQMDANYATTSSISSTGGWYHIELPGGWSFQVVLAITAGNVTIPATLGAL